jgi:hypothetical protein
MIRQQIDSVFILLFHVHIFEDGRRLDLVHVSELQVSDDGL